MKLNIKYIFLILFSAGIVIILFFSGKGVIVNNSKANIYIPEQLVMPLQVKVAYDKESIYFRYRWPAKRPNIYHDLLVFKNKKWTRIGKSVPGPHKLGIYEDRLTMFVDDGSVPLFAHYGGYITIGHKMRFFTDQASKKDVKAHAYLGKQKRKSDVRKYLPNTRTNVQDWKSIVSPQALANQRRAGYFLDLWHWRAHRSNPIGMSDDQYVADYRYGDSGEGPYTSNWDKQKQQPKFMFNKNKLGFHALRWQDFKTRKLSFDKVYYLETDSAVAFDPTHVWKEGDTIPRRLLRKGEGSRANISVHNKASWKAGYWDVTLKRVLDTKDNLADKQFFPGRIYNLAFAVHRNATGSRWHYISLPVSLGLGRPASIKAVYFEGDAPNWKQEWSPFKLFYPGQVSWPLLVSKKHAGQKSIKHSVPTKVHHTEEQLAIYGVEIEFQAAIVRQWLLSILVGSFFIIAAGIALIRILRTE